MATVNFTIGPPRMKWQVDLIDQRISLLNNSPVCFSVFADGGGQIVNPLSYTVEFAFKVTDVDPSSGDWKPGTWDVTSIGQYRAQINCGSGGANLAVGEYFSWVRITVTPGTEQFAGPCGQVIIQ